MSPCPGPCFAGPPSARPPAPDPLPRTSLFQTPCPGHPAPDPPPPDHPKFRVFFPFPTLFSIFFNLSGFFVDLCRWFGRFDFQKLCKTHIWALWTVPTPDRHHPRTARTRTATLSPAPPPLPSPCHSPPSPSPDPDSSHQESRNGCRKLLFGDGTVEHTLDS